MDSLPIEGQTPGDARGAKLTVAASRDPTLDVARGLAIFMMVAANLAATALEEPHPLWFRLYGSLAAPLFVFLSGMMVAYTTRLKGYSFRHFAARGAVVIGIAALLEVFVWKFYPFISVDVLYLIGVLLPVARLALSLSSRIQWLLIAGIFLATPLLQGLFGYADYPSEISLANDPDDMAVDATSVFNHWLLDGWFPLFPWLGFGLLGVQLADLRVSETMRDCRWIWRALLAGGCLSVCGAVVWWLYPGELLTRGGYSELFYPPTPGFIVTAIGLTLVVLATIDRNPRLVVYRPLRLLGESALAMYLLHIVAIKYIVSPAWSEESLDTFGLLYAGMLLLLLLAALGGRILKARWRPLPFPLRILVGS
jgi:uncharacterized membrane protein